MHGRNLTGSVANVFDLDVFIRDNRHDYDAFIFGFAQQQSISAEIAMTFAATVEMKVLFYLRSQDIHNALEMQEVLVNLKKYIRFDIPMTINANMKYSLIKRIRKEIINSLEVKITISLRKVMAANDDACIGFTVATIDRGKVMSDIEDFAISDIENMTVDALTAGIIGTQFGLRVGLIRPLVIANIQDLRISQIQNRTIEDICFTRIS